VLNSDLVGRQELFHHKLIGIEFQQLSGLFGLLLSHEELVLLVDPLRSELQSKHIIPYSLVVVIPVHHALLNGIVHNDVLAALACSDATVS